MDQTINGARIREIRKPLNAHQIMGTTPVTENKITTSMKVSNALDAYSEPRTIQVSKSLKARAQTKSAPTHIPMIHFEPLMPATHHTDPVGGTPWCRTLA